MTLVPIRGRRQANLHDWFVIGITWLQHRSGWRLFNRLVLKQLYIMLITFMIPVLIVLTFKDLVRIMSAFGIITPRKHHLLS